MLLPCIKCQEKYEEKDVEAYYCPSCLEEKNKLAKELDRKFANRVTNSKSELKEFEEEAKVYEDKFSGRKIMFIRG